MKILFHICCGPCAIYPLKHFLSPHKGGGHRWGEEVEFRGFFYNPNIHPYTEYKKRLEAVKLLAEKMAVKMIYRDEYNLEEFLGNTVGTDLKSIPKYARCSYCYSSRLEATVQAAKENGFDYFSSSLLYSRYQNHELIKGLGLEVGNRYGVPFYYEDFRTGWKEGIKDSREMGLYRQQYCGCIYSEKERYAG